uniref:Uncharacterized protein n=1 Tax=Marseillevirus LCMAC101 TaxID=2506602 RepID=A0A481YSF8_9VIRU|nr:MAG: uncharacterized protein LCMAC101_02800 [Marseillevirus LCMAC101]
MASRKKVTMSDDETTGTDFMNGQEKDLLELVSKLDFIANLKLDEVMYVNSLSKSEYGWGTSLHRSICNLGGFWTTESKKITLDFFKGTIDLAFKTINDYMKKNTNYPNAIVDMIVKGITESKKGIANYRETCKKRKEDIFVSEIDGFLKILDVNLENLQVKLKRRNQREQPNLLG